MTQADKLKVAEWVRGVLRRAGLTVTTAAPQLGYSRGLIADWTTGTWPPTIEGAHKLAALAGETVPERIVARCIRAPRNRLRRDTSKDAAVTADWEAGYQIAEIAARNGVSQPRTRYILRAAGYELPTHKKDVLTLLRVVHRLLTTSESPQVIASEVRIDVNRVALIRVMAEKAGFDFAHRKAEKKT